MTTPHSACLHGFRGFPNRFSYGNNDPLNNTDPTGRCPACVAVPVGVGVGYGSAAGYGAAAGIAGAGIYNGVSGLWGGGGGSTYTPTKTQTYDWSVGWYADTYAGDPYAYANYYAVPPGGYSLNAPRRPVAGSGCYGCRGAGQRGPTAAQIRAARVEKTLNTPVARPPSGPTLAPSAARAMADAAVAAPVLYVATPVPIESRTPFTPKIADPSNAITGLFGVAGGILAVNIDNDPAFGENEQGAATPDGVGSRSLEDPSSLRGATPEEVEALIPSEWGPSVPLKKGVGKRWTVPGTRGSDTIMIEEGVAGHPDPVHRGPYLRVSRQGKVDRIPLFGNPVLGR